MAKKGKTGFSASALQVRRAWEHFFGRRVLGEDAKKTYADLGNEIVAAIGLDKAEKLILGMDNDPSHPDPEIPEEGSDVPH